MLCASIVHASPASCFLLCFVFNSVGYINTEIEIVSETQFIVKIPQGRSSAVEKNSKKWA